MKNFKHLAVIILAAGKGTRMKSDLAKVLHKVADKSMVIHVVEAAIPFTGIDNIHVVVGHQADRVKADIDKYHSPIYAYQADLLGTGDAVKTALPGLKPSIETVLVLCGDVPLIRSETLENLIEGHLKNKADITVLAAEVEDPTGYGRVIHDEKEQVLSIREEADTNEQERRIKRVNTGIYCFNRNLLELSIEKIQPENNQREYYLTDVIEIAQKMHRRIISVTMDNPDEVMGVNTLQELEKANTLIQK